MTTERDQHCSGDWCLRAGAREGENRSMREVASFASQLFFLWFKTNYPVTKVTYCFFKLSELQQGGYHEAIELSLTHVVTFCLNKCHVFAEWKPEAASPELLTATKHHSFSSFQAPFLQSLILRRNFKR